MPTLNHDSSAIAVNPIEAVSKQRSRRIVGVSLGATLVTMLVLFAAMALAPVDANAANTCTLTSTSVVTLWGDTTKWSGCGGTYPGQGAGDTAIVTLGGGYTLKVDAFNNPVILQVSGSASSIPIQIATGGTLTLETSSTATSSNTFTVDSGGTMGTNSGANIAGFQANVHVNGGTFTSDGTIALTSGTFTFSGGNLNGTGTINITNSGIFDGAVSPMSISGTTINDSGFVSYSSTTNPITLAGSAKINVTGAGQFSVSTDAAINGTASETISIASGASMQKTSGTGFNTISPFVKNDGTMNVSGAGAGGGFGLSGNGTHSGSFVTGTSSQTIAFGGNNTFNSGASFSGSVPIKFVAGTQTFNAAVSATTGLKWTGGTIAGTGPFNISGTSSLDGSNSGMILTGVINNTGTMTYAPTVITNLLTINGASAKLETNAPGTFTIAGDYDIQAVPSGAGTLRVVGSTGQIFKSAGASGSSILANVDNSGGIVTNNATGALNFAGGGKSTGTMTVSTASNTMNFTNGTFDSSGVFSGAGTINVAGGTLNINTATSFGSGSPSFNLNGGTLGGTGTVTILGASNWSSGTITGSSPFNVSSTGAMAITGALGSMTLDGRTFNDNSSVVYNSPTNNLTLKNSASMFNSGTFTATGGGTIDTDGSAVSMTNNGQFNKTNSGVFFFKPSFNNNGTGVAITGGVLVLDGDGVSSAPFTMTAGTEVWFPTPFGTTYTWTAGTSFSGGKVTIDGNGNVANSIAMTLSSTNIELNGGTFTNNAAFTITSPASFKWTDGTLTGAGHTIITSGTTFDMLSEFGARSMSGHTIDNAGNATMSALTQPVSVDSSSTFNNSGTLDIQSDGSMLTNGVGVNTFNNSGIVKKSVGGSGFRFDVPYNQTAGTTDANSPTSGSTIIFNNGGTMSGGAIQATASTNFVDFFNGTFNVIGGSLNNGQPGALRTTGAGAILNVNAATSTTKFIQNFGTVQGAANLTVPSGGTYTWNGGTMTGSGGQFVIASGGTLDVAGATSPSLTLSSKTINNSGTITYHPLTGGAGNQLTLSGTASIANQSGALISITDNSAFLQSGGTTSIVNSGTFQNSGSSSVAPTLTNNAGGLVKANGGMLTLLAGTSSGTLDAVSPGAINFSSGATFTVTGGTWGNSGGGFWITGGIVTINAPFSLSGLALNSGQLDGTGTIALIGTNNIWGSGTMAGSGITNITGSVTLKNGFNPVLDTRTLNNSGTINDQDGDTLLLKNGAVLNNSNLFDMQGDPNITCNCATPPLFHNIGTGTIQKSSGTGVAIVSAPFTNDGTVNVNLGQIAFSAAGAHTGAFNVAGNANVTFTTGNTFSGTSSLTGAGEVAFNGGTSTIGSGTVTPGTFTVNGANVALNSAATIGTLNVHNAATLGGTGTIHLTAASPVSEWSGGTINGSGTLTVNAGANFQLDGLTAVMTLDSRPLVNNGTLTYSSTTNGLILANSAVITNSGGATLNLDAGPGIGVSGVSNVISNAGLLQRNTAGTIGISPAVVNSGTINANLGTLAFNGGLTQTIGSTNLLGGSISSPSTIALSGGTLTGNGTVAAAVNNTNGIVAPGNGSTAGTITITGAYAQGVNGGMNLKLGGTSNYDIVDASASGVTLGGTLTVSLFNSFVPAGGNTFDVLRFSTRSGDFANYFLPTFAGGGSFQKAFVSGTPNLLRLTAAVTASDLQITQSAPASVLHGQNGTWTLTITNGPTPVTNVVVTDTFANATFVIATSIGVCTPSGSTVTCNLGSLAANQSVNVTLQLNAPNLVTITNSASVTATEFDPNTVNNNTGNAFTTVFQSANLSITNTASSNPVNAGSPLSFAIVVSNGGPDVSGTLSLTNTFPSGVASFTFSGAGWNCAPPSGNIATCTHASSLPSGASWPALTLTMAAPASGPAVDSATVTAGTGDPNTGNNTASQSVTILAQSDLSITKTGPASSTPGSTLVYTITVTNNGPSDATAVTVTDPTPAGATFVSNNGACITTFPCALGTMTAGQTKTITTTFSTPAGFTGTSLANTATVSSATTPDPNAANNSATATTAFGAASADLAVAKSGPASATNGSNVAYTVTVTNNGPAAATGVVLNDPTPGGLLFISATPTCVTGFPCTLGNLTAGQSVTITVSYTVTASSGSVTNNAFVSGSSFDPISANDNASASTAIGGGTCGTQPPTLIAPANGAIITSPVTFSWTAVAGATGYKVFASIGGASTQEIGNTASTSITLPVAAGTVVWSVQALGIANCSQLVSATRTFTVCSGGTPELSVVGTSSAGQSYTVQWTDIGASTYELEESSGDTVQVFQVTGLSKAFTKSATTPTAFFYRVRALSACGQGPGPFSASQRVVVVPIPPINAQSPSATVDINNKHVVVQTVFIPGQGTALAFTASTDEPWLTVTPSSGILPVAGLTLSVSADPADLPNGTFTATIILTFPGSPAKIGSLDAKPPVTIPVSISVVTPVSPTTISTPSANSLIIPSVGHLDGINSQWRSDVRITNTAPQKINYLLRFTPAGGAANSVKQTQVSIAANDTMALDDIVKNWYGVGALGDAANGVLEVRPLNTSGKGTPGAEDVSVSFATVASSRTFNQSTGGTLGQYIPAIPFASFIGKVTGDPRAGILSLQQIAQSPAFRTNLGIVEAAGKSASVLVSVFDAAGKNLLEIPLDLKAGEQQQLNSFLEAKNITLTDGRVEVKVTGGDGKVTAYASVVDNKTTDPLLVSGVPLVQTAARTFVLPGVADITNDLAKWRSDVRIFNAGVDPQYVTLTLYPLNDATGPTISRSLTVNPGEVTILDNIVASRFGATNIGGAMHVDTLTDANLVVTGRTYNQIDGGGTFGQFIAAVTPADAVGKGTRVLNVLQVEDSTRYRTNLGIAEVSGKPVTVEVSVFLPDAKVAPKVTIPLAANEYRQFRVLQQLGVGTAYNARIAIKVIDGDGRITAYGSVIDMQTQDPTYVPAQ
ncbi:MAG TPA: hypothetical protein VGQ21_11370 [Thermoanaerobaculia bacterium]|jgi:uncharacterized repeat protein (TIGR01451 family)|nr:hypothetical protein [Thermoanaerobaculia bacterium]